MKQAVPVIYGPDLNNEPTREPADAVYTRRLRPQNSSLECARAGRSASRLLLPTGQSAATREWGRSRNHPLMLTSYLPVPVNVTVCGLLFAL